MPEPTHHIKRTRYPIVKDGSIFTNFDDQAYFSKMDQTFARLTEPVASDTVSKQLVDRLEEVK